MLIWAEKVKVKYKQRINKKKLNLSLNFELSCSSDTLTSIKQSVVYAFPLKIYYWLRLNLPKIAVIFLLLVVFQNHNYSTIQISCVVGMTLHGVYTIHSFIKMKNILNSSQNEGGGAIWYFVGLSLHYPLFTNAVFKVDTKFSQHSVFRRPFTLREWGKTPVDVSNGVCASRVLRS